MRRELLASALAVVAAAVVPALAAAAGAGASLALDGGGLTVDGPPVLELPPVLLTGSPVTVEAALGPFRVMDTRPSAAGWTLVATATRPRDARGWAMDAPLVVSPRGALAPGAGALLVGEEGSLDAPRALLSAPPGTGTGALETAPVVRLTVPADTPSAAFSATLTVTIS